MPASARSAWLQPLQTRWLCQLLTDNIFAAWNACRVRGGKQAYPAPFSGQQNRWQGPRTLSSTAARLVGYCLIVSLKHFRGQCNGPLHTSSAHIPPPNGTVTRGWLLPAYQPEVLSRSRWLAAAHPIQRISSSLVN